MSGLSQHLGQETLPPGLEAAFVQWCVWEQARPALRAVLDKIMLHDLAAELAAVNSNEALTELSERILREARGARQRTGPLGLSAAEAAAFEFYKLVQAAGSEGDPQEVAFFAVRVCGWAGWAATDFRDTGQKSSAEAAARQQHEDFLQRRLDEQEAR